MASCSSCGKPLPAFSLGPERDRCSDCEGAERAPLPKPSPGERFDGSPELQRRIRRPSLLQLAPLFPVTTTIVGLNIVVFLAMVFTGVSPSTPTSQQIIKWGANAGRETLTGQYWRLLTSTFVHIGILHITFNMWCLWDLGQLAERIFRKASYVGIYLLSGLAGSIASLWRHPFGVSAGASGAIFGVAGALITALYLGKLPVPKLALTRTLKSLLFFAGFNLLIGQALPGIDNSAHLGGLAMGLALGAVLARSVIGTDAQRHRVRLATFSAAFLLLLAAFLLVRRSNAYVVDLSRGSEALDAGKVDLAIEKLAEVTRKKPSFAPAFALLGNAYLRQKDTRSAEEALRRSLELDPHSSYTKYNLGLVYLRSSRLQEAKELFSGLAESNPKDTRALLLLGATLDEMGQFQDAIAVYKRAAQVDSKDSEIYGYLGAAQLSANLYDDAIASFEQALQLKADYKAAELGLAAAYRAKGLDAKAAAALERASKLQDQQQSWPPSD